MPSGQDRYPQCAAFLRNVPELLVFELMQMALSWFGVLWPGNPLALGTEVLREEVPDNLHFEGKFIHRGTVTIGFMHPRICVET